MDFLYAKQDLMNFHISDLQLLAKYIDINSKNKDKDTLAWLLAITLLQAYKNKLSAPMPNNLPNPTTLENLPAEMIVEILSNVDRKDLINACKTNKLWSQLCKEESIWKKMLNKDYPDATKIGDTWYQSYIYIYNLVNIVTTSFLDSIKNLKNVSQHLNLNPNLKQLQNIFIKGVSGDYPNTKDLIKNGMSITNDELYDKYSGDISGYLSVLIDHNKVMEQYIDDPSEEETYIEYSNAITEIVRCILVQWLNDMGITVGGN